jgi:cation transport regulator
VIVGCRIKRRPADRFILSDVAKPSFDFHQQAGPAPATGACAGHLSPGLQPSLRFNHAFASHAGEARQEEIAHRTAWTAVKRSYVKIGEHWMPLHNIQ